MALIPFPFQDYNCHLRRCTKDDEKEGCKEGIWTYEDQLKRDYPSFGQIRAAINQNSKSIMQVYFKY